MTIGLTLFFSFSKQDQNIRKREGYLIVALSWIFMAGFGMLPYILSHQINGFADALFETMSGLTTTGASILTDIEAMPKGLLFLEEYDTVDWWFGNHCTYRGNFSTVGNRWN